MKKASSHVTRSASTNPKPLKWQAISYRTYAEDLEITITGFGRGDWTVEAIDCSTGERIEREGISSLKEAKEIGRFIARLKVERNAVVTGEITDEMHKIVHFVARDGSPVAVGCLDAQGAPWMAYRIAA